MVVAVQDHDVKWLAPAPIWSRERYGSVSNRNGAFSQPTILRFDNDLFMDELLAMVSVRPDRMPEWIAVEETWREPMRKPPSAAMLQRSEPISRLTKRLQQQRIEKEISAGSQIVAIPAQAPVPLDPTLPFKLYQPAQQRFYLIAASLVCSQAGLPDRAVDDGKQEQARFVVRRVIANDVNQTDAPDLSGTDFTEYAFVSTEQGFTWKSVDFANPQELESNEERLPLFAINFDHQKEKRRMLSGLVPVGRRDAYLAAPRHQSDIDPDKDANPLGGPTSALGVLFQSEVVEPWKALEELAFTAENSMIPEPSFLEPSDPGDARDQALGNARATLQTTREQIQTGSWYVLLDFAIFLRDRLARVWNELNGQPVVPPLNPDNELNLKQAIESIQLSASLISALNAESGSHFTTTTRLIDALKAALLVEDDLESIDSELVFGGNTAANTDAQIPPNSWPTFLFPLAHPGIEIVDSILPQVPVVSTSAAHRGPMSVTGGSTRLDDLQATWARIDALLPLVEESLPVTTRPPPELEPMRPPFEAREPWFIIRCVYERPNCGPFHPPIVSEATQPFQLASFFDSDAPQRPIRIPMPLDISPAGLRKFKKNATLMFSDMLCGKVSKIKKLTFADLVLSVLPWPFHKDLPSVGNPGPCRGNQGNFGMWCSLSIPIVTLCALILLIIMVALFDIFFKWIPFLFLCLPILGMKGKK